MKNLQILMENDRKKLEDNFYAKSPNSRGYAKEEL